MYEFTKIERIDPTVKPTNERIRTFEEINNVYSEEEASVQASRCLQCGNPYCSSTGCPLSNNIPQWLKFVAEKDLKLAFDISNETSPFPEILGRICPQSRLCEGACTLNDGNETHNIGAITIGSIEVAISEKGFDKGYAPEYPPLLPDRKVAIIGSGPAGISCATFLLRAGVKPVVFEKADQPGGLMTYGIPGFKLEKASVLRRIDLLLKAGMELHLQTEIGKDVSMEELRQNYDAIFIGTGATAGRVLDYEAYNADNLFMAVPFLTNTQKRLDQKPFDQKYDVKGKNVLVIGGGDTAMDCVRTSIRDGANMVACYYRRDEVNMPGSRKEYIAAKEEGVHFHFQKSPKKLMADKEGNIIGVRFVDTALSEPGEDGRQRVEEVPGSEEIVKADIIILALGFGIDRFQYLEEVGVKTSEWGAIEVDENKQTSVKGIYAGGDNARGADLVVTAALDGREAALHILETIFEEQEAEPVQVVQ